jgi:hypothetical protein
LKKANELAKIDGQHIDALMDRWHCEENSCPNNRGWCYLVDKVHLRMMAQHMKTWSMAINVEEGDLETAPSALAKTFMPSRKTAINPFRETPKETPAKDINATQGANLPPPPYPPYSYSGFYPYASPQYPQLPPHPLHLPQLPEHATSTPEVRKSPVRRNDRSSSLPSEVDPSTDKLVEYFKWLTKVNPMKAEPLAQCLERLRDEDIVFGTIGEIPDTLFDKWGVSDGIRLMLKSYLRKWEHAKAKGRA